MVTTASKSKVDFTEGKIFPKLIRFAIPITLTGLLSTLYNATDMVVVGNFSPNGSNAMGAVGSCGSIITLFYSIFVGLSAGAGILTAQSIGAKRYENIKKIIDTSIIISSIIGLMLSVVGFVLAEKILILVGTPPEILGEAIDYFQSYSIGFFPALMYNFLASIVRSCGDSKSPLLFLAVSGLCNVVANFIFVLAFNMGAMGVGLGTTICQYVALLMVIVYMIKRKDFCHLSFKNFSPDKHIFSNIVRIGLPTGFQASFISISNVLIQSAINSFGNFAVNGNSAAANIESFGYNFTTAIEVSVMTMVGQNYGAKKYDRISEIIKIGVFTIFSVGLVYSLFLNIFGQNLLKIYEPDSQVVRDYGMIRIRLVGSSYCLVGIIGALSGALKGLGKTLSTMFIHLMAMCGFRVFWILVICAIFPNNIAILYLSWPIGQILATITYSIYIVVMIKKLKIKQSILQEKSEEIAA